MSAVFGALALIAAGFVVYFLIDRKDKNEESDSKSGPMPPIDTPPEYKFPGEHPGRKKPRGGGGGPQEPL